MDTQLDEIFTLLDFSEEKKIELKKIFNEILVYKLGIAMFENLTEDQKNSLNSYLKSTSLSDESIKKWFSENVLNEASDFNNKFDSVFTEATTNFFKQIIQDLDSEKVNKVSSYLKEKYIKNE